MRKQRTTLWALLVMALCIPIGMLVFPGSWDRAQRAAMEPFDNEIPFDPTLDLPMQVVEEEPTVVATEPVPPAPQAPRATITRRPEPAATPEPPAFEEVPDEPIVVPSLHEIVTTRTPESAVALDPVVAVVEPPLPAWDDSASPLPSALADTFDPDSVARDLTEDEEQQVRQTYRAALDNLRRARSTRDDDR